jgi:polyisoprenoid-binding protein YceI
MTIAALAILLLTVPADAETRMAAVTTASAWTLVPARSRLYVRVYRDESALASGLAHDHAVLATGWSGRVEVDPARPDACQVTFDLPVGGLVPDPDDLRRAVGLPDTLSAGQRESILGHILDEGQLWADRFPSVTWRSSTCSVQDGRVDVTGRLSIRGVGLDLTVPMSWHLDGPDLVASGRFQARATDFGFKPFTAMLGAIRNQDRMDFVVEVRGVPATPASAP